MKKFLTVLLLTALYIAIALAQPDTLWTRTYGTIEDDYCFGAQQTADSGFILAGQTVMANADNASIYLVKTDSEGDTLWTSCVGGICANSGCKVQQTSDGGYIIVSDTFIGGAGDSDVLLVKTDDAGNEVWSRTYGGTGRDVGNFARQTQDGGYIIVAETWSYGAGEESIYLIKTDADGDTLWTNTFGGHNCDEGLCVQQIDDGNYIITGGGNSYTTTSLYYDVYLLKIDPDGNEIWMRTYGGEGHEKGCFVEQTYDGGYIITGVTTSYSAWYNDVYLIRTDDRGDTLWTNVFGGTGNDEGHSVAQTSDGSFIVGGTTTSYGAGSTDIYLIKTDASGDEQWNQTYGGTGIDMGFSVQQTTDGGYVVGGYTNSFGISNDFYLIRLESENIPIIDDLTIIIQGDNIILEWSEIPEALSYYVYRDTVPYYSITGMTSLANPTLNTFEDTGAAASGEYYYRVTVEYY